MSNKRKIIKLQDPQHLIDYIAILEARIQKLRERIKVECYCRDRHCIWCEALQQDDEASK